MRTYAFLKENIVDKVETIDEIQFIEQSKNYQLIVDVHDYIITPQVGWVLVGNSIIPSAEQQIPIKEKIKATIKHYQEVSKDLLIDLYADNTLLGITSAQSSQMFDDYSDVVVCICQGAFPTAIYKLQQKTPSGFVTQQMIDSWISRIQSQLV